MEKSLGQDEINAMFQSARLAATALNAVKAARESEQGESYNFSRAGQISNDQMKAISTVNDLFARNLTHNLGAWLRTQFQVNLVSAEQMVFQEFLERIPALSYVCSSRLEPLDALAVMEMDLHLAPPIVDLLLGGMGRAGELREPTEIEDQILMSLMEIVVRELNIAWQPVGLRFALEKRESESEAGRLMTTAEKTLCVSFEIRMPEAQGTLNLCLPAVVLNTILRRLVSERDRPRRRSADARMRLTDLMGGSTVGAVLQFPALRLAARDLVNLMPGNVLRLPLPRNASAELRVEGLPVFQAQMVRSGEHRGAQVAGQNAAAQRQCVY